MKTPKENLPKFHLRKVSLLSVFATLLQGFGRIYQKCRGALVARGANHLDETCVFGLCMGAGWRWWALDATVVVSWGNDVSRSWFPGHAEKLQY